MMKRKMVCIVVCLVIFVSNMLSLTVTEAAISNIIGDVNGDNMIGLDDAQIILKGALNIIDTYNTSLADVNDDGIIDLKDAQDTLKVALKIVPSFEVVKEYSDSYSENIYKNVLNQYYAYLINGYDFTKFIDTDLFSIDAGVPTTENVGYAFIDVDNDSKKELLIGFVDDDGHNIVADIPNDKAVFITMYSYDQQFKVSRTKHINNWEHLKDEAVSTRNICYYLCEGGKIGLNSHYNGDYFYLYNGKENALYFEKGIVFHWNDMPNRYYLDVHGNESLIKKEIGVIRAEINEQYKPIQITYTPFSEWVPR